MEYIAARALLFKDGKVLLVREKGKKHWSFPGGGVKEDSDIESGLKREMLEELSLKITNIRKYCEYTHVWSKSGDIRRDVFFLVDADVDTIEIDNEIEECVWFDYGFQEYNLPMNSRYTDRSIWERLLNDGLIKEPFRIEGDDIDRIQKICEEASDVILKYYNQDYDIEYKDDSHKAPVTQADKESDKLISSRLKEYYPDFGLVTEEGDNDWKEYTWCVDPLDGTRGFVDKNGCFQILVGLMYHNYPIWGFIYSPIRKIQYYGGVNIPATKVVNSKKIKLSVVPNNLSGNILILPKEKNLKFVPSNLPRLKLDKIFARDNSDYESKHIFMFIVENEANLRIDLRKGIFGVWDMCAPQAILQAANGFISDLELFPLRYYVGERFLKTGFIVTDSIERARSVLENL